METPVRYLELAVKCDRLAKLAKTDEDRMIFKEMAEHWRKLTRETDRIVINEAQRQLIMRALTAIANDRPSTNKGRALSRPTRDEYMQLIRLFGTLDNRNRHCPKCQGLARQMARGSQELPVPYFHVPQAKGT